MYYNFNLYYKYNLRRRLLSGIKNDFNSSIKNCVTKLGPLRARPLKARV